MPKGVAVQVRAGAPKKVVKTECGRVAATIIDSDNNVTEILIAVWRSPGEQVGGGTPGYAPNSYGYSRDPSTSFLPLPDSERVGGLSISVAAKVNIVDSIVPVAMPKDRSSYSWRVGGACKLVDPTSTQYSVSITPCKDNLKCGITVQSQGEIANEVVQINKWGGADEYPARCNAR